MATDYEVAAYLTALVLVNDSPLPRDVKQTLYQKLVATAPADVKVRGDKAYVEAKLYVSRGGC